VQVEYKGYKNWSFSTICRFIWKTVQYTFLLTTADLYEVVYDPSIGTIFNDLERSLTQILTANHYSTFSISNTAMTVLSSAAKDEKATLMGRNVPLSDLLINSCTL